MLTSKVMLPKDKTVKQLMFFAHGYGSNADDLLDLARVYRQHFPDMGFVSVNAPLPVYQNGYAWFELEAFSDTFVAEAYLRQLAQRAERPAKALSDFIDQTCQKFSVSPSDVILTGFSQGSLISLYSALISPQAIKAVIAFSAVPLWTDRIKGNSVFPVLLTHGTADPVIPPSAVDITVSQLKKQGFKPEVFWQPNMGHAINEACLNKSISFLKKI